MCACICVCVCVCVCVCKFVCEDVWERLERATQAAGHDSVVSPRDSTATTDIARLASAVDAAFQLLRRAAR